MALLLSEKGTQMKAHKAEKVFHIARLRHSLLLRFTTSSLSSLRTLRHSRSLKSVLADFQVFSLLLAFPVVIIK